MFEDEMPRSEKSVYGRSGAVSLLNDLLFGN